MKKSLFDENNRYTPNAIAIDGEANAVLTPIFQKYLNMGYSPQEIAHIMSRAVLENELAALL